MTEKQINTRGGKVMKILLTIIYYALLWSFPVGLGLFASISDSFVAGTLHDRYHPIWFAFGLAIFGVAAVFLPVRMSAKKEAGCAN